MCDFSDLTQKKYLQTPMDLPENVCINLSDILQEFIEEYNITELV